MTEQQLDPATFDLDAWLDGVKRLRATVTLYARRDLMPRIDEIVAELEPLVSELNLPRKQEEGAADESLAEAGAVRARDTERAAELRAELTEMWGEYEASGVVFELQQLASDEYDEIVKEVEKECPEPAFDAPDAEQARVGIERNELGAMKVLLRAVTAVGPHGRPRTPVELTAGMVAKMGQRFGIDQFGELIGQARALTLESRVDAPFSLRVSQALAEKTSG